VVRSAQTRPPRHRATPPFVKSRQSTRPSGQSTGHPAAFPPVPRHRGPYRISAPDRRPTRSLEWSQSREHFYVVANAEHGDVSVKGSTSRIWTAYGSQQSPFDQDGTHLGDHLVGDLTVLNGLDEARLARGRPPRSRHRGRTVTRPRCHAPTTRPRPVGQGLICTAHELHNYSMRTWGHHIDHCVGRTRNSTTPGLGIPSRSCQESSTT
jgi:hypothetical protein